MRIPGALAFLLILANTATAAGVPTAKCAISFSGTSSLHGFGGTIPPITTHLEPSATSSGRWNADLFVTVATMDTSNESRDARMREMLDAAHFPDIHVTLREIDPQAVQQKSEIAGTLTIAGRSHDFVATLGNWREDGEGVSFDAISTVSLSQFGLAAPTVLGLIRVADEVGVTAHVVVAGADILRASAAAAVPPRVAPREQS